MSNIFEDRRIQLHHELVELLGSNNVYFQPPESIKIKYPAIIYERENIVDTLADNIKYLKNLRFRVTVVDLDPDSVIVTKLSDFRNAQYIRHYVVDGLNHDTFRLCY